MKRVYMLNKKRIQVAPFRLASQRRPPRKAVTTLDFRLYSRFSSENPCRGSRFSAIIPFMDITNGKNQRGERLRAILLGFAGKPTVLEEAERLRAQVESQVEVVFSDFTGAKDLSSVEADLVIVLGGDGSILRAAHQMGVRQLPVAAVNLGRLGYLANVQPDELVELLSDYRSGAAKVVEHLMFEAAVLRNGKELVRQLGLNELAVLAGPPFSIISLNLFVDDEFATTYSCDGLIVATPVGSTAHSLSAGGPILRQSMQAFALVPVGPHALTHRPVVDSADRVYELEVVEMNPGTSAVIDGRVLAELQPGDRVRVAAAKSKFKLIVGPKHGYYRTLREKLGWSGSLKRG